MLFRYPRITLSHLLTGIAFILFMMGLSSCRISSFDSPEDAAPGSQIQISVQIVDTVVPENDVVKGVIALLLPSNWDIQSAQWEFPGGGGNLDYSPVWTQRAAAEFPLTTFEAGMHWVAFRTDSAFSYGTSTEFQADFTLQVGDELGLYKLGCVATRNNHDGNGSWTKVSYPHFTGVPALSDYLTYRVEAADDWTSLFYRDSGWSGGDGTYSIPLNGNENFDPDPERKTLIHFSDTFVGEVSSAGVRLAGTHMINNSQARFTGFLPLEENINFVWGANDESNSTWIVPETPASEEGDWFWQMDGISLADSIHIFELRMRSDPQASFAISGVVLASGVINAEGQISGIQQKDMPIEYTNPSDGSQIAFGQAVLAQTARSGCPEPDGYIYIYGPRSFSGGKALVAARVVEDSLSYAETWRFWDGVGWSTEMEDCADIFYGISQEHSVTQTGVGDYLITFMQGGVSGPVCIAHGESPVGPFSFPELLWTPPETNISNNVFTYNAKAHPHLSAPGELLISYEVNTFDFWEHFSNADIYHARFIRMVSDHYVATDKRFASDRTLPAVPTLRAFPNPFNSSITLHLASDRSEATRMTIYDLTGRQIRNWNEPRLSGRVEIVWDGQDYMGEEVPTGIYIVQVEYMEMDTKIMTKITLLR